MNTEQNLLKQLEETRDKLVEAKAEITKLRHELNALKTQFDLWPK